MIEKLLNYFGYVKKSKQYLQKTDVMGSAGTQEFVTRKIVGVCNRCGGHAVWDSGFFSTEKLCNRCDDIRLGLD